MMHGESTPIDMSPGSAGLPFGAGALPDGAAETPAGRGGSDDGEEARGAAPRARRAPAGDAARRALEWALEWGAEGRRPTPAGARATLIRSAVDLLAAHADPREWRHGTLPGSRDPRASMERAVAEAEGTPGFAGAERLLLRPHWSEPSAAWLGRLVAARLRGARVLLVVQGALESLAAEAAAALGGGAVTAVVDDGLDAVRALAPDVDVELDVFAPEIGPARLEAALVRGRRESRRRGAAGDEGSASPDGSWFGAGLVERPFAAIRVRASRSRLALVGPGLEPLTGAADMVLDGTATDVGAAAAAVAEGAFGATVMGGYGSLALGRAVVAPRLYSAFTEALLEQLAPPPERERPDWLQADGAALPRSLDEAVLAARRTALDEGGTLILERRGRGGRRVVFANVEARMQLGAGRGAPCVLALMRGTDTALRTLAGRPR